MHKEKPNMHEVIYGKPDTSQAENLSQNLLLTEIHEIGQNLNSYPPDIDKLKTYFALKIKKGVSEISENGNLHYGNLVLLEKIFEQAKDFVERGKRYKKGMCMNGNEGPCKFWVPIMKWAGTKHFPVLEVGEEYKIFQDNFGKILESEGYRQFKENYLAQEKERVERSLWP